MGRGRERGNWRLNNAVGEGESENDQFMTAITQKYEEVDIRVYVEEETLTSVDFWHDNIL